MKTPHLPEAADRLAERARDEIRTHQEYLAAVMSREVAVGEARIKAARFPPAGRWMNPPSLLPQAAST